MEKETIKEMLKMIDAKIEHIEDITADNRAVMIKLVKQGNQVVKFLSQLDISMEDITDDYLGKLPDMDLKEKSSLSPSTSQIKTITELVDEYIDRVDGLKELEEELKKNKDQLTPGTVGES